MRKSRSSTGTEEDVDEEQERISEIFVALSEQRRRYTIYCLYQYTTPMALADLTDEIVRLEIDTAPTAVPEIREQIYTQLYHRHLPKLAETNLVAFDMNENLVSLGDAADEARPYLQSTMGEKWPPK